MLEIKVVHDTILFGKYFGVNFQRTLRIPDDGKNYPLPPGLGSFPVLSVKDYRDKVPESWLETEGVFIPMYQREAMWINFISNFWRPNALKIAVGKVNVVSGKPWEEKLNSEENDYLVSPPQPWLDGINAGEGIIKQFIAMPLGMGYTVEAQVTGEEKFGGMQIVVYESKPGKFPDKPPVERTGAVANQPGALPNMDMAEDISLEMGLAGGGKMEQKIYPDPHGIDTWDNNNKATLYVHIVNSMVYREITGEEPPITPVTVKTYNSYNFPWFELYDEKMKDIKAPDNLKNIKSVKEMDKEKGFKAQQDDTTADIPEKNIIKLKLEKNTEEESGQEIQQ